MKENDLLKRTFNFGISCLKFLRKLESNPENNLIRFQLGKSCTSIGANYEESQAGSSKADFTNKVKIALREARETNYYLSDEQSTYLDARDRYYDSENQLCIFKTDFRCLET